jgi:ATP-dependent Lhr-like helicase
LQAIAVLRLTAADWVEDLRPPSRALHVLAHQVMALVLQEGGLSRHRIKGWIEAAFPFRDIDAEDFGRLVDTMLERGILYEADGLLSLGARGERLYGRANFFELYAVFSTPPVLRVLHGLTEIGQVQAQFISLHDPAKGPLRFRLAGRAWEVVQVEWTKGVLRARPAEHGRVPTWLGQPGMLSEALCSEMRRTLLHEEGERDWLTHSAREELSALREDYAELLGSSLIPLEANGEGVQWHTFAGAAINRLLAAGLGIASDTKWVAGNLSLRCGDIDLSRARDALKALSDIDWGSIALDAAHAAARGPLSKFQPCLPRDAEDRFLAERLLDVPGVLSFLSSYDKIASSVVRRD